MPVDTQPFRREIKSIGGVDIQVMYYFDVALDKWLSVTETTFMHARNSMNYAGYLRSINGVQETGTHGPMVPYDCTIVWVALMAENTPDTNAQIWSNGANLGALTWNSGAEYYATDIDVDQGQNISVNILLNGLGVQPNRPIATMGMRWRL